MPERNIAGTSGIVFTENMGQVPNDDVLYYSSSGSIAFSRDSVFLYSSNSKLRNVIRLEFAGCNDVAPEGRMPLDWKTNFFLGQESNWRMGVDSYGEIIYRNVWDNIDLVYYIQERGIKYDFIARPGSDISDIRIRVSGHKQMSLSKDGDLKIGTGIGVSGEILDSELDVFYSDNSERVGASFSLIGPDTYYFSLDEPDSSRTIVIDPLIYSTFLGGSDFDHATDVWAGEDGCAYLTGYTDSLDFITTPGSYDTQHEGMTYDIFITKMALNGDGVVYSTLLGAGGDDRGNSICVDSGGYSYITGITSSQGFPTTYGAFDRTYNGDAYDAFVTKLGPKGDMLVYSTLLGTSRVEHGNGICLDKDGNAFVTGEVWRPELNPPPIQTRHSTQAKTTSDFPTTPGALDTERGLSDVFVTKLSAMGNELIYSTAFGSTEYDVGKSVAVDKHGYAYVTGYTKSENFPVSPSAFDGQYNDGLDCFVTKITPSGSGISYSTFLGGGNGEMGHDIAVGEWGYAYVTGYTRSRDFPVTESAHSISHSGNEDAFVTVLGRYGDELAYSTFLGGANGDRGKSIYIDRRGMAVVAGNTYSQDFPVSGNAIDGTYNGGGDAFITRLSLSGGGEHFYSSYLGGNDTEQLAGIGAIHGGFTYVVGDTCSAGFPTTPGALDDSHNGETDIFVTKLDLAAPYTEAGPDRTIMEGDTLHLNGTGSHDNHIIVNHTWEFFDGAGNNSYYDAEVWHRFDVPGTYNANLTVTDLTGNWAVDSMTVIVLDITPPNASAGQNIITDEDRNITLNGSASYDNVGIVNYTWEFTHGGIDIILYGPVNLFNFTEPGIYTVTLTAIDMAGNAGTDELTVRVNDITRPTADPGDHVRIYNNTLLTLDGTASYDNVAIVDYQWTITGPVEVKLSGPSPSYKFERVGDYSLMLNVTDAAGNWDSAEIDVHVMETVRPVADAGADIITREGVPTAFDGSGSWDNAGISEWLWSFNDGVNDATISGERPIWTFRRPGTYEILLNVTDAAGNWDTDTLNVTVEDMGPPRLIPCKNKIGAVGQEIYFDDYAANDSSGIAEYAWRFTHNDTLVELEGPEASYIFWRPGAYTVNLTVTDTHGNAASVSFEVMVQAGEADVREQGGGRVIWVSGLIFILGACVLLLNRWRPRA